MKSHTQIFYNNSSRPETAAAASHYMEPGMTAFIFLGSALTLCAETIWPR